MNAQGEYIGKIFSRMDLQQIREFLLYGAEEHGAESEDFHARLKNGSDPIYNRLINLYPESNTERDEAANDLSQALAAHDAVYMEMGMKAGARLIYQLLLSDNPSPTQEKN